MKKPPKKQPSMKKGKKPAPKMSGKTPKNLMEGVKPSGKKGVMGY